jgi:hypothetical protein
MARANEIQEEIKETRQHIENAGSAMVEKLELLEQRLREGVEEVKRNFDLHYQVRRHPLALFGGSVLVGYLLGQFFGGHGSHGQSAGYRESSHRALPVRGNGMRDHLKKELRTTVKGMAAGALTSTLWEMAKQTLLRRGLRRDDDRYSEAERDRAGKDAANKSGKEREL